MNVSKDQVNVIAIVVSVAAQTAAVALGEAFRKSRLEDRGKHALSNIQAEREIEMI